MDRLIIDTTFLIDLQNENRRRGRSRGARAFLEAHPKTELFLPVIARGEYLEGFDDPDSPEARSLIDLLTPLEVTDRVASTYASVVRRLRREGNLIGANDLWIGSTALAAGLPLITRNPEHFARIPGLTTVDYRGRLRSGNGR